MVEIVEKARAHGQEDGRKEENGKEERQLSWAVASKVAIPIHATPLPSLHR